MLPVLNPLGSSDTFLNSYLNNVCFAIYYDFDQEYEKLFYGP